VPFGYKYSVTWPDGLEATVYEADRRDVPDDLAVKYPGDVEVQLLVLIANETPADLTIPQARVQLWYGPSRMSAVQFAEPGDTLNGISGFVRAGGTLIGDATFAVPRQYLSQLVFELRPRPADAPAQFFGGVD
jgi:hypothetical protein